MFDIEEELKKLPDHPGVYIMRDNRDAILYIGKAISLKRRVRQYFQSSRSKSPKIEKMVAQISRFEYILTDSELEALVLECNLIKEHRPKYNTMLKDDKTYPYLKVTLGEAFPRVLFSRQMKKDNAKYFGPYSSAAALRDTQELLQKLFLLRSCNRVLPRDCGKERPCLNYHIHQCKAPCQGYVSEEAYGEGVKGALSFLNGNYTPVTAHLEEKMQAAAAAMEFEDAARLRDLLLSVRQVAQKQKITDTDGEDRDIIALAMEDQDAVVQVFFVREGRLMGREHYHMVVGAEEASAAVLSDFLRQYYAGTPFVPREIMLREEIADAALVEDWLSARRGQKCHLRVPKKGSREKLVELAAQNARLVLSQDKERLRREEGRTIGAAKALFALLDLPMEGTGRMEAFDISNISGFQSVGSMVVYEKGKACRADYRRFRLKSVAGPDDYASMREVLSRRFQRALTAEGDDGFCKLPALLLMDGGRGQVNIALQVLSSLGLSIPVCGMVKDDHHRTRGLYFENKEIKIDPHSEAFHLITRIQDEAHRFAIEYHRSLRSKGQVHSVLDEIPGIGPARRKALMRAFSSIEEIKAAKVEALAAIDGMNRAAAESVYTYFRKEE